MTMGVIFIFLFVITYTVNYTDQIQGHKLYSTSQTTQSSDRCTLDV